MSLKKYRKRLVCRSNLQLAALAYHLHRLCVRLNQTYQVNLGGCCYVAYCIAQLLEQDNLNFSVVVFDERYDLEDFTILDSLPEAMDHYAIILETGNIPSNINCDKNDFCKFSNKFKASSSDLLHYYHTNAWNECYDDRNNQLIKQLIEEDYYEFTESLREG